MARKRIVTKLLAAMSIAAAGWLMPVAPAHAVFAGNVTTMFELDGNVANDGTGKDDWTQLYTGGGTAMAFTGITADPAPKSIFTGGGSKDDLDLSGPLSGAGGWKFKDGSVPDKDDITNAYAAAYNIQGDLVIYAGADRFDNSGDAFIGFWFFQNPVAGPVAGGPTSGSFTGTHAVGDILVLANFTGGGTTVNIEVLKWVGSGGNVNGTLQRIAGIAGGTPALCGAGAPNNFCGITNPQAGEQPPWAYLSKSGTATFPAATFFELGINVSAVFRDAGAGSTPCFTNFMAETRSSSSVSATLKDFVMHSFPVCGIAVTKACGTGQLNASDPSKIDFPISGQVQNTGFGALSSVTLTDNPVQNGSFAYYKCLASGLPDLTQPTSLSPLAALQTVCYKGTQTSATNGPTDTVTASASTGSSTVTASASATCTPIIVPASVNLAKTCSVTLDQVAPYLAVKVNVKATACNTGQQPLTGVSVTDTDGIVPLITLTGSSTIALGACEDYTGSYYPPSADNRLNQGTSTLVPGLARFTDTVSVAASAAFGTVTLPPPADASCNLCPTCSPDACTAGGGCTGASSPTSNLLRIQKK